MSRRGIDREKTCGLILKLCDWEMLKLQEPVMLKDFWNMMESFGGIYSSKESIYYLAYMGKITTECKCLKVLLDVILRKGKWRPCGRRAGECQSPGFNLSGTVRNPRVEQRHRE